jgi:hypothetical protein
MDTSTVPDAIIRNAPPLTVAGASYTHWFSSFPVAEAVQWATLLWIVVQAGFYFYDRIKKGKTNGS